MTGEGDGPRLKRSIGTPGAILLAFNGVLGSAIFALPATLAADFGSFSPWLFPLVALVALLIVIPFAHSAGRFPESGGPAEYGRVFGRFVGFELGWLFYLSRAAAFAANANVLAAYLSRWWVGADQGLARAVILVVVCTLFAGINIAGVRRALAFLGVLTVLKALPLLIIAVAALLATLPLPAPGAMPPLGQFEAGALIVFYAFVGFENAVVPAGETRRPGTVLPRAIFITLGMTTLLYFLVQAAFIGALPGGGTDEKAPLIDLGAWVAGPAGAAVITLAAICSLGGNLHSTMTSTPRVTYALARRGDLPGWFGRVNERFLTPANSIAFLALFAGILALVGSYVWLAIISVLARLFVYAVTIAALPRAPGRAPVAPWLYVLGAAGIALCVWGAAQATWDAWQTLGLLALAGAVLFAIAARKPAATVTPG
ncbi:amino acid permease [Sphingomonas sabuli]|uniref:Arginine/agmatine antiporter n=1 Tax=Sphingomonas sabuli TaxID=2764186 RepID=A0A7G9L003_9SPHN|nr:APC family permease [Sphingomonas sabuli]QNM81952.1 amino acid permease [Sphingomonas sabuli]